VPYAICAERLRLADAVREATRVVHAINDADKSASSQGIDTPELGLSLAQAKKLHWDALAALKQHRKAHKC
jgi:hypothetical protein